jgi:predicted nucleic acid-binding protein
MYLLDTNVVSELRRRRPDRRVVAWLEQVRDDELRLSAVTLGELQAGVEIVRAQDTDKAVEIEAWVDQVAQTYAILAMDGRAFRLWARLMHRQPDDLIEDAVIAATALVHHLTVVTRNVRDFARLGASVLDPFATAG